MSTPELPIVEETVKVEEAVHPGALRKPRRDHLLRHEVLAFNPPAARGRDGQPAFTLIYVDPRGNLKKVECTKELWVTVDGRPQPGRKLQGLEVKKDKNFLLYVSRSGGKELAVSFSEFPSHVHSRQAGFPEGTENIEGIEFQVDATTGSLRVEKIPQNANSASIQRAIRAIDSVSQLYPGQVLASDIEVLSVSGNRVSVSPPVIAAGTTGYRSDGFNAGTAGQDNMASDGFGAGTV